MIGADTWRVSKSKHACSTCGVEFSPGQVFFSGLREDGTELVRLDFCPGCWSGSETPRFFCFWRSRRDPSEQRRVVNKELVLEFFDRLDSLQTDQKAVFRFVLALYLMRRREFKLLQVVRADGAERLLFERRSNAERVEVDSPGLTEDQIQQTEAQLSRLLNACL